MGKIQDESEASLVPESKEVQKKKKIGVCQRDTGANQKELPERAPNDQSWDNLNNRLGHVKQATQ